MMESNQKKSYSFGLDLMRAIAVVFAFCLHFYYENGFYFQPVTSVTMFFHAAMRDMCFCSVPLFLVITGYLKCGKEIKKGYYRPLIPLFISWLIISIVSYCVQAYNGKERTLSEWILQITQYKAASYSWYLNMYFGMFLISPYIHMAWNRLETKESHQKLLLTVALFTHITESVNSIYHLLPSYWTYLWPFSYYLLGCYIRTYQPKISVKKGSVLIAAIAFLLVALNWFTGGQEKFNTGYKPGYSSVIYLIYTGVIFCTFYSLNCSITPVKTVMRKVGTMSALIVFCSEMFNKWLFQHQWAPEEYVLQGLMRVNLSLLLSFCTAWVIQAITKGLMRVPSLSRGWFSKRTETLFAAVCFVGLFVFCIWKCQMGFGNVDESFYLITPLRLSRGVAPLVEEWHGSQFSGMLLMPVMWVYRLLNPSGEGILLHFRIFYICIQCVASIFLYSRWKRLSPRGALPAALLFFLFAPFGITAFSYNSMGLLCVMLSATILLTAQKHRGWQEVLAGLLFAAAVLCCPTLPVVYLLYALAVLLVRIGLLKPAGEGKGPFAPGCFFRFTLGAAALALITVILILSRTSIQKVLEAIPYLLSDPEHPTDRIWPHIQFTLNSLFARSDALKGFSCLYILAWILSIVDRRRKEHRFYYWAMACAASLGWLVFSLETTSLINVLTFALAWLPPLALLLFPEDRVIRGITFILWLPGVLYGLCISVTSNQYYLAMEIPLMISTAASVLILPRTVMAMRQDPPASWWVPIRTGVSIGLCVVLFLGVFGGTAWRRYQNIFWESNGIEAQTERLSQGPEAGLLVTPAKKSMYESAQTSLAAVAAREPDTKSVAFFSTNSWYYLMQDWDCGIYSGWLSIKSNRLPLDRIRSYYALNPDQRPDLILSDDGYDSTEVDLHAVASELGYTVLEDEGIFHVLKKIE